MNCGLKGSLFQNAYQAAATEADFVENVKKRYNDKEDVPRIFSGYECPGLKAI